MIVTGVVDPRILHRFPVSDSINGLTLLNNELYVLYDRDDNQVDVYSTIDFNFLRHLSVDGLKKMYVTDIVSCSQKRCIYISNNNRDESGIHRLGLDGSVCKWPLNNDPQSMAVTRSSNLLVVVSHAETDEDEDMVEHLLLLSGENGERLQMIKLQLDVDFHVAHSLQLTDDLYVICYSSSDEHRKHRVSHVDADGRILRSTDRELGLRFPWHMSADSDKFLFVAEMINGRILLFDPSLEFVFNVTEGIAVDPMCLHFDEFTRRLYVGESKEGGVVIVQL